MQDQPRGAGEAGVRGRAGLWLLVLAGDNYVPGAIVRRCSFVGSSN